jgi:hypothetical protein
MDVLIVPTAPNSSAKTLFLLFVPPPKPTNQTVEVVAKSLLELKNACTISRDCLDHRLNKTSFPPCERNFSFQPSSFFRTQPSILAKVWSLDRPTNAGSPKYFSSLVVAEILTFEQISSLNSWRVFLLKRWQS